MVQGFTLTIPCKIEVLPHYNRIKIIADILGSVFIDQEIVPDYNTDIIGSITLIKSGDTNIDIPCKIDIQSPKYEINIPGSLTITDNNLGIDIRSTLYLEPNGDIEYTIPCRITTNTIKSITDLECNLTLELSKVKYDPILSGILRLVKSKYTIDLDGSVTIIGDVNKDYHTDTNTNANEFIGTLVYEEDTIENNDYTNPIIDEEYNIRSNEILGSITLEPTTIEEHKKEIDPYIMHYTQYNEIIGSVIIEKENIDNIILTITTNIEKYNTNDDSVEDINKENYELLCSLIYEKDTRIIDLYGSVTLERSGYIDDQYTTDITDPNNKDEVITINNSNELIGYLNINIDKYHNDILNGTLHIPSYYKALYIPCRLEIRKREYIYSIFNRITIPPERILEIPCRITIERPNIIEQNILEGSVILDDYESYNEDILKGSVIYKPGICIDLLCTSNIDAIYTRREIPCSIYTVNPVEYNITSTIEINDNIKVPKIPKILPTNHYPISFLESPILNDKNRVHISIDNEKVINTNTSLEIDHMNKIKTSNNKTIPKGKIAIVVSPTWSYEPYVLKGSLITFLDRYYQKADISIVFGGAWRSDFDIINLSLNYRIRKENLCGVRIDRDPHDQRYIQEFTNKFIDCMINFKKNEYKDILRVFMFINQPNWYYNDPLSPIATYCRENNISTVAISPGGEYCEILEVDKIIDDLKNAEEWTRQHRYHRTDYINIKLPLDGTDRIVY